MIITQEIKIIRDFGLKHGWPAMVLKRDGDRVVKILGKGKNAWRNMAFIASLNEPYNNNFNDLINAVKNVDIWRGDT